MKTHCFLDVEGINLAQDIDWRYPVTVTVEFRKRQGMVWPTGYDCSRKNPVQDVMHVFPRLCKPLWMINAQRMFCFINARTRNLEASWGGGDCREAECYWKAYITFPRKLWECRNQGCDAKSKRGDDETHTAAVSVVAGYWVRNKWCHRSSNIQTCWIWFSLRPQKGATFNRVSSARSRLLMGYKPWSIMISRRRVVWSVNQ